MANRRMFALSVIDTDQFLDMPQSSQLLYFHLGMRADDEGFVDCPRMIMRLVGSSEDDLRILVARRFITPFNDGILIINHWKINNQIRSDRMVESRYHDRISMFTQLPDKSYVLSNELNGQCNSCQPDVNHMTSTGKPSIGRDRLGKYRLDKEIYSPGKPPDKTPETPPSDDVKEIVEYLNMKTGSHYKPTSKKTKSLIHARMVEGFTVDDFKTVIANKTAEWSNDPHMCKYLRPETLFGTKFEGYLNQRTVTEIPQAHGNNWMDLKDNIRGEWDDHDGNLRNL